MQNLTREKVSLGKFVVVVVVVVVVVANKIPPD